MAAMSAPAPTVLIADDHPLFRVALRLAVQAVAPAAKVIEADSFESTQAMVRAHPTADLLLLDLMMPGVDGMSSMEFIASEFPAMRVAVVSSLPDTIWQRLATALGAVAYIHKSLGPDAMQDRLRRLLAGEDAAPRGSADPRTTPLRPQDPLAIKLGRLSPQELRVMLLLRDGRLNKQIASDLGIGESTVKTHISAILRKLDLRTRTQAAVLAQRLMGPSQIG